MRVILAFLALAQVRWTALDLARFAYLTDLADEAYTAWRSAGACRPT